MSFIKKWYTYQKERFPILIFGLYVLCIVIAVFGFANFYGQVFYQKWLNHIVFEVQPSEYQFDYMSIIPMFVVCFLQFLMIRIVDEFKDYEEDCKYRPYRPVPRGLITLRELKVLLIICVILQLIITILFTKSITGIMYLIILWIFFGIMSKGFFMKKILDKHILLEVTLDELMMPLLVIFLISFTPMQAYLNYNSTHFPDAGIINIADIWKILVLSYLVSWIVEVARKIRAKEQEENGVKTYTAVLGIPKAISILTILEILLAIVQYMILGSNYIVPIILICAIINIVNILFVIKKSKTFAKMVELSANIYIMLVYLSMLLLIV